MAKIILILGVLFSMTAIVAGALEHKVREMVIADTTDQPAEGVQAEEISDPAPNAAAAKRLANYETGVRYHMYAGLGMIGLGLVMAISARGQVLGLIAGLTLVAGAKLFSGTLYLIAAFDMAQFTFLVPIGGSLTILGWLLFLITVLLFEPLVDKEDLE